MNQLLIEFIDSPVILKNADIVEESMTLTESICSDTDLRFGACESSVFGVRVLGAMLPITGRKFKASMRVGDELHPLGHFKVHSDKPTADRKYRDVVAYDAMTDIINAEVSAWYQGLPFPMSLKAFRDSFFNCLGIEQEETELVNDSMTVNKTIEPEKLSGKTVITAICEINGVFGRIGRNGKFVYKELEEIGLGLYPSNDLYPSDDLFPILQNVDSVTKSRYISCKYEDYSVPQITKLQIRQEENDIGCIVGSGNDAYVVQNNFLVYGKGAGELQTIAQNLFNKIRIVSTYRPFSAEARGSLTREVGQPVTVYTTQGMVTSYILCRTLTGIQSLRDSLEASGSAERAEVVNGVQEEIIQLQSKTNKLTRTVDETRSEIKDTAKGLESQILQNAQQIQLRVTAGEAVALINLTVEKMTFKADQIELEGYTTINNSFSVDTNGNVIINANHFKLDANGNVSMTGTVNATSGGKIGGLTITDNGSLQSPTGEVSIGMNGITSEVIECKELWASDGVAIEMEQPLIISGLNLYSEILSLKSRVSSLEAKGE